MMSVTQYILEKYFWDLFKRYGFYDNLFKNVKHMLLKATNNMYYKL